jgi:hypothetical protein
MCFMVTPQRRGTCPHGARAAAAQILGRAERRQFSATQFFGEHGGDNALAFVFRSAQYAGMNRQLLPLVGAALLAFCSAAFADVSVKGYYRKDGTYVAPHTTRSGRLTTPSF